LEFRHLEYLGASFLVLMSPKTPIYEIPKWQCVVKYRSIDEILSEDLRSVMTIRLEEETRVLMPQPLSFIFMSSGGIGTVDPKIHESYLDCQFVENTWLSIGISAPERPKGKNPCLRKLRNPSK